MRAMVRPVLVALVAMSLAPPAFAKRPRKSDMSDADTEVARRHFRAGAQLYDQGEYAGALLEFEAARRAKPLPELDFNVARCYDRMERWREAIDSYEKFVATTPSAADADEATRRIFQLRRRVSQEAAKPPVAPAPVATPPPPVPENAPPPRRLSIVWPAVVGAVGLAGAAVGAGMIGWVAGDVARLQGSCAPDCARGDVDPLRVRRDAGVALLAVGGGILAADVVLWVLWSRWRGEAPRAWLLPAAGGVVAGGVF
jgi:tetratricopeptide (TPR) repeat protein